jgi:hypothetical protein
LDAIHREQVSVFFGRKGTGKSELARYLFTLFSSPWRICIDVKDELEAKLPGVPTVEDPYDVLKFQTVRVAPRDPDDEAFYDELFRILFENAPMFGGSIVWWDEMDAATSPHKIPKQLKIYMIRGRSRGCGLLGCTTRPANTHPVFLSQADHVFVHKLRHSLDIDAISRHFDIPADELSGALDNLPEFGFLHYEVKTGELESCDPVHDPDALTAELRRIYFGPYDPR